MQLRYSKYSLGKGVQKIRTNTAIALSGLGAVFIALASVIAFTFTPAAAASSVVYNNVPNPLPGNLVSQAFEAQSASEFGGQIALAGTARTNPTVTVIMSSWGCETGSWFSHDCVTTPGATFSEPITLNVYSVGAGGSVGSLLTSSTQTFNIPFRPSADNTNCTGATAGEWFSVADNSCYNGFATPISFTLNGVTLPDAAIVSVAYNTSDYGYAPYGDNTACHATSAGCGYDSLNVGLTAPPSVGSDPMPDSAYINSTWSGAYCSGATGTFRLDGPCWTGYQPAIKVEASNVTKALGSVTGGLTLSNPRQQISFNAFDFGANSTSDRGNVEYQNFEYPGGLHYTAPVECATVSGANATIMFQIPAGFPGLSGLYVVANIHDGGSPGTKDTYAHGATADHATALSWCENANPLVSTYRVTGGNAVVH